MRAHTAENKKGFGCRRHSPYEPFFRQLLLHTICVRIAPLEIVLKPDVTQSHLRGRSCDGNCLTAYFGSSVGWTSRDHSMALRSHRWLVYHLKGPQCSNLPGSQSRIAQKPFERSRRKCQVGNTGRKDKHVIFIQHVDNATAETLTCSADK